MAVPPPSFTRRGFQCAWSPNPEAGTRKAALAWTVRKANGSSARPFWGPSGFLRFSHLGGNRRPRRALDGGPRIAAAEREEPRADGPGAENEHDAVGPSLEGVSNALWGWGRGVNTGRGAGGVLETQTWGVSGLL